MPTFKRIKYEDLNLKKLSKAQENYNYGKLCSALADYGYTAIRLFDDRHGADLLARHYRSREIIDIQQKTRLWFDKKYIGKDLWIAFPAPGNPENRHWYLYDHDKGLKAWMNKKGHKTRKKKKEAFTETYSWKKKGLYHFSATPTNVASFKKALDKYLVALFEH